MIWDQIRYNPTSDQTVKTFQIRSDPNSGDMVTVLDRVYGASKSINLKMFLFFTF